MLNKNLRTVLYYVVTVSVCCLLIEFSKRVPDPRTQLSPKYYEVVTASQAELKKLPKLQKPANAIDTGDEEDVIPKRNRGKLPQKKDDYYEGQLDADEKTKFREWKKSNKFKPSETGLFRKWKKEQRAEKFRNSKSFKSFKSNINENIIEDEKLKKTKPIAEEIAEDVRDQDMTENNSNDSEEEGEDIDVEEMHKTADDQAEEEEEREQEQEEKEDREDKDDKEDLDTEDLIDYPSGLTEWAAPADMSCAEFSVTPEMVERQQMVREACDRLEPEMGSQRLLYSRLRWAVPQRLLYCPVFKAASTSWLVNYFKLSNSSSDPKEGNLHSKITNLFPPPATFKLRKKIYNESVKFIIVRHPFERLVSAYRDKLAGFTRNKHYLDMRKIIIRKHRKDKSDRSAIPTFKESVDFVLVELRKMEAGSSDLVIDGHFMPYTRRCIPCAIDYDVIIKFESLEADSEYMIEQCHLEDVLEIKHENAAPTGPRTAQGQKNKSKKVKSGAAKPDIAPSSSEKSLSYFKDIDSDKIQQLYKHYKYDFEIFDYSADEYFEL